MAWIESDLAKIEKAIATGARRVRFKDHDTEFHSLDEMLKIRDLIRTDLGVSADGAGVSFVEYHDGK